jgi:regulator of sirC expression with transglutaminase-like and TPR domain
VNDDFDTLAQSAAAPVEELALALAGTLRDVDRDGARARLDELAGALPADGTPEEEAVALAELLGSRFGFSGDRDDYDNPKNSMLDLVLERRRGLPIALSVVYEAVARRAGVAVFGIGLPGHFVVGHFGASPPVLLDPFGRGRRIEVDAPSDLVRPWTPHETALRMLNNLVAAYGRRMRVADAIACARMRLALPLPEDERPRLELELRQIEAQLN